MQPKRIGHAHEHRTTSTSRESRFYFSIQTERMERYTTNEQNVIAYMRRIISYIQWEYWTIRSGIRQKDRPYPGAISYCLRIKGTPKGGIGTSYPQRTSLDRQESSQADQTGQRRQSVHNPAKA